ncbi:Dor1-like family-domain-containing protein [Kalaharituber pfeilii]|nr:Dor1-like family-domain-containing protein [Kalaharituber pfeilii]
MSSSDPLVELLAPHLAKEPLPVPHPTFKATSNLFTSAFRSHSTTSNTEHHDQHPSATLSDPLYTTYLSRLSSLPLSSILTTEPASLQSTTQSLNLSIQSLSSRSHKALITSSQHLSTISSSISSIQSSIAALSAKSATANPKSILTLDHTIQSFLQTFQKDCAALQNRSQAHLLSQNLDRILDILELPTLLSSSIASGNYPTSLDILSHVRRLVTLYPDSPVIMSILRDCEALQRTMVANLIASLTGSIKLPMAMKTVGWLKRVMPEMGENEDVARGIFLVCRLSWIESLFQALDPLRELADEEKQQRLKREKKGNISTGEKVASTSVSLRRSGSSRSGVDTTSSASGTAGQHTERYLKRWIEIFREQSFAVVSMYRSIFPSTATTTTFTSLHPSHPPADPKGCQSDPDDVELGPPASPFCTFILHLISLLDTTLKTYLNNIQDKSSRESLLTQVLYAAGSLGRLGGDFSGIVACLGIDWDWDGGNEVQGNGEQEESQEGNTAEEWVEVMKKHKVLASRLEQLAAGAGVGGGGR